jgi:hypothetical protein
MFLSKNPYRVQAGVHIRESSGPSLLNRAGIQKTLALGAGSVKIKILLKEMLLNGRIQIQVNVGRNVRK